MISERVKKEYGVMWREVIHYPVNICLRCGAEDDPETTKHWSEDNDGDKICPCCDMALMTLARVEIAICRLYKSDADPRLELWHFNGLTELIFIRNDLALKEQIEKLKAQTPIDRIERRDAA
jgi:hypothetical protein